MNLKPLLAFCLLCLLCFAGCQPTVPTEPPKSAPTPEAPEATPDEKKNQDEIGANGLSNRVFGNCLRVRTQGGTGSGSIVDETASHYIMESNHHVSSKGTPNQLDIFIGGKNVGSVRATTQKSWFRNGQAHDLSETLIPKSALGGPLPVVPTAPSGYTQKLKVGQAIYTHGCQQGQWPRARHGNIVGLSKDGLIYYEPESIPGDSGSGVYLYDPELGELCIGRTAWTTDNYNGKPAGIAMSSDRVRAIRAGQVSFTDLPQGCTPIPLAPAMAADDTQEVFARRWKKNWDDTPTLGQGPLNLGLIRPGGGGMNLRSGLGFAVTFVGLAVGAGVVIYVIRSTR